MWALSGGAWTQRASALGIATISADPSDPNLLAFGVDDQPFHDENRATGVWLSRDGGSTWAQLDGLPLPRVAVVAFDPHRPGRLLAGTTGAGFWVRQI